MRCVYEECKEVINNVEDVKVCLMLKEEWDIVVCKKNCSKYVVLVEEKNCIIYLK